MRTVWLYTAGDNGSLSDETWLPKIGGTCISFNLSIDANSCTSSTQKANSAHPMTIPSNYCTPTHLLCLVCVVAIASIKPWQVRITFKYITLLPKHPRLVNAIISQDGLNLTSALPPLVVQTIVPIPQQQLIPHMIPKEEKDHKVDLHTHSPDKSNIGRDSQLLERKAHGSLVKNLSKESRCETQWLRVMMYNALHGGVKLRKHPSPGRQ